MNNKIHSNNYNRQTERIFLITIIKIKTINFIIQDLKREWIILIKMNQNHTHLISTIPSNNKMWINNKKNPYKNSLIIIIRTDNFISTINFLNKNNH